MLSCGGASPATPNEPTASGPIAEQAAGDVPVAADAAPTGVVPKKGGGAICSGDNWCWHNPLPQGNALRAVWGDGKTMVAVGAGGTVLSHDGSSWSAQTTASTQQLNGVWGHGARLYAVGMAGTVLRRDGNHWKAESSGSRGNLQAVWTDGEQAFAVGKKGVVIAHQGGKWSAARSGTKKDLYGVWGSAKDDVYAAGRGGLIHYDGSSWSKSPLPGTVFGGTLQAVWGSAKDDVYAAGWDRSSSIIFHRQGGKWIQSQKGNKDYSSFYGLAGGDGQVTAVGARLAFHHDGASWKDLSAPKTNMRGVWLADGAATIVGDQGRIFRARDGKLEEVSSGYRDSLDAVWGSGDNNVYAVGYGGRVLHFDGSKWKAQQVPTTEHLRGIWGTSADDVHVVGDRGTILHYDGSAWKRRPALTDEHLLAIAGSNKGDIWAVGRKGTTVHYDGKRWKLAKGAADQHLHGVWSNGETTIAVGRLGFVIHHDGHRWSRKPTGTTEDLYGVWAKSKTEAYAVGDDGMLLRFDGNKWKPQPTSGQPMLRAIDGRGGKLMAVGAPGAVLDGSRSWKAQRSGVAGTLRAVWISPKGAAFAVGDDGAIVVRR